MNNRIIIGKKGDSLILTLTSFGTKSKVVATFEKLFPNISYKGNWILLIYELWWPACMNIIFQRDGKNLKSIFIWTEIFERSSWKPFFLFYKKFFNFQSRIWRVFLYGRKYLKDHHENLFNFIKVVFKRSFFLLF